MRGIARTSATALTVLMLAASQRPSTGNDGQIKILSSFSHASSSAQRIAESRLAAFLSSTRVDHDFRELTREPHVAGSARNNELAHFVAASFRSAGLEEVVETSYDLLMSYPKEVVVEMVSPRLLQRAFMTADEVAKDIVDAALKVHRRLGARVAGHRPIRLVWPMISKDVGTGSSD